MPILYFIFFYLLIFFQLLHILYVSIAEYKYVMWHLDYHTQNALYIIEEFSSWVELVYYTTVFLQTNVQEVNRTFIQHQVINIRVVMHKNSIVFSIISALLESNLNNFMGMIFLFKTPFNCTYINFARWQRNFCRQNECGALIDSEKQ